MLKIKNAAIFIIVWMSSLFTNLTYCKDYCRSELCDNSKDHILCKFKLPGPSNNCGDYERLLTTDKEKQDVLDKLNSRRNKIASGEIRSLPAAENMMKLIWNEELELFAQRWADQCVKSSSYRETDSCRDLENTSVGQNIATIYGESPGLTASSLVDLWYMELLNVNASILQHYMPSSESEIQHYDYFTQLAWADSTEVGCGGVKYKELNIDSSLEGSRIVYRLVCNFAPSGNHVGLSVYNNGIPCSRCPVRSNCDPGYRFLCATKTTIKSRFKDGSERSVTFVNNIIETTTETNDKSSIENSVQQNPNESEITADTDSQFDFMSHLLDITKKPFVETESTTKCREVLAIDEFLELLKSRLSNDQILKELLLSTTKQPITESIAFDKTVAALIDRLYTKKETTITTTSTESNIINSTFLADLVKAVILKQSDKYSSIDYNKIHTDVEAVVTPVKIQAEVAGIKPNIEFTGHYFIPEDEEQPEQESTVLYDDAETIPGSEIILEIEDLKRNRVTRDFIDAILESDFDGESVADHALPAYNDNNGTCLGERKINKTYNSSKKRSIVQRNVNVMKRNSRHNKDLFINYSDLLKHLAEDLRVLKLNERFHCSYNFVRNSRPTSICLLSFLQLVLTINNLLSMWSNLLKYVYDL